MKREAPLYPMKRNMNPRMRYNINMIHNSRLAADHKKERTSDFECRKVNGIENAPSLAMVFSPIQEWRERYDVATALERGTLFKELDKPFEVCNKRMGGGMNGF